MKQLTTKYTKYTKAKASEVLKSVVCNWRLSVRSPSNPPLSVFAFESFVCFVVTQSWFAR
jgi:hypothetical protein